MLAVCWHSVQSARGHSIKPYLFLAVSFSLILSGSVVAADMPASPTLATNRHVVLMVWDGMRPDLVTEKNTPTLYKLSREGVFFKKHHPVYPSSTEVNGTAIATGMYPAGDGIMANKEYRPEVNPRQAAPTEAPTEAPTTIQAEDKATGGKYIQAPTIAETIRAAGYPTAIAGTKGVALLFNRGESRTSKAGRKSVTHFVGNIKAVFCPRNV